jgi:hypothetical protein
MHLETQLGNAHHCLQTTALEREEAKRELDVNKAQLALRDKVLNDEIDSLKQ